MNGTIGISVSIPDTRIVGEGQKIDKVTRIYNSPEEDLKDIGLALILWREDGQRTEIKRFWSVWRKGDTERKEVEVSPRPYQKVQLRGTAHQGRKRDKIEAIRDTQ